MTNSSRLSSRKREDLAAQLVDPGYYLERYPDVRDAGIDAAIHYFQVGWAEGRMPNALFDTNWYLRKNPDVERSGICPLIHFIVTGWQEGRDPHPLFSTPYYLQWVSEADREGMDPLSHYLAKGSQNLLQPHCLFDPVYYSGQCERADFDAPQGLTHYLQIGWRKHLKPHPLFDPAVYEASAGKIADISPLEHYVRHSGTSGLRTHLLFDGGLYLSENPDVAASGMLPLVHYLLEGFRETRKVGPAITTSDEMAGPTGTPYLVQLALEAEDHPAETGLGRADHNEERTKPANATAQRIPVRIQNSLDIDQLLKIKDISEQQRAVAIVCWDGGHNPVGRAKVLYEAVPMDRPKALITYLFPEFGGKLWPPVQNENINFLGIPWNERYLAHELFKQMGIRFDTVWICKPRLPGFILASNLASDEARIILDIDDNEEHFSRSAGSRSKPYGLPSIGLSRKILEKIPARTVASATLMEMFGGQMVRHARRPVATSTLQVKQGKQTVKVGFLGTVRPHKKVLEVAQAIREIRLTGGRQAEFHVYGDIAPRELQDKLRDTGAQVHGIVPFSEASKIVENCEVMITGFPSDEDADREITRYQITAKIGDSLAAGKPVLVPDTPGVRDLSHTPGIYLFSAENFEAQLERALNHTGRIELPEEFTFTAAERAFNRAEAEAGATPAAAVFNDIRNTDPVRSNAEREKIILVWKQHDAGLYGRRIDQLARKLKAEKPEREVIVLEFLHQSTLDQYKSNSGDWTADFSALVELAKRKAGKGWSDCNGVRYVSLHHKTDAGLSAQFTEFIVQEQISPRNSRFVLFPIIRPLKSVWSLIRLYPFTVDVVDNQFAWASEKDKEAFSDQYRILFEEAEGVVFNSERNLDHFRTLGMIPGNVPVSLLPNWYQRPVSMQSFSRELMIPERRFVYTGNMNDRIDWKLMNEVADLDYPLHLVGSAYRAGEEFRRLISRPNVIYHGPLNEEATYRIVAASKVAIMPHLRDKFSDFMNPLKLLMYRDAGIPIVASNVEGIDDSVDVITIVPLNDFADAARRAMQ